MVYVDNFYETGAGNFGRMKMSHMIADTKEELLLMADKIGVQRKWIQEEGTYREHFDVSMGCRKKAIESGAKSVTWKQLGQILNDKSKSSESPSPDTVLTEDIRTNRGGEANKS